MVNLKSFGWGKEVGFLFIDIGEPWKIIKNGSNKDEIHSLYGLFWGCQPKMEEEESGISKKIK